MFNLQGSEIIIVLLLALVVLGPEKLPDAMRKMGQAYAELKKMSSGFQSEFRAAVDEPLREVRDTANVLRDSADFTKLKDGTRQEKPKSGEMAPLAPADPDAVPIGETPTFDTGETGQAEAADGPTKAADSKPAPFVDDPAASVADPSPSGATPAADPITPPPDLEPGLEPGADTDTDVDGAAGDAQPRGDGAPDDDNNDDDNNDDNDTDITR